MFQNKIENKKHKIIFLIPPANKKRVPDRIFGCNYGFFQQHHVFLLQAVTFLEKSGFDVQIIDCVIENKTLLEVLNIDVDIFIFYSVFLSREIDLKAAKEIEKVKGNIPIIFIGSDPSYKPEIYLLSENRFVIRGEPELAMLELCNVLAAKKSDFSVIKGISWKKNGHIIQNKAREIIEDLDILPSPNRMLLKFPYKYFNSKFKSQPSTTLLTSRGCAWQCIYCVPNSLSFSRELEWKRFYGNKPLVTKHSAEHVIEEFKEVAKQGFKSVAVLDDQFLWERSRTEKILDGIKDLKLEISVLARADMITDIELTRKMSKAGIAHVALGVESFNQEILNYVRKDINIETIDKAIRFIKESNMRPEINILLGSSPLETTQTIEETLSKVKKLGVDVVRVSACTPFPGTTFYELAKKNKWMTTEDYVPIDPMNTTLISYPHLSDANIVKAMRTFNKGHYFSYKYIIKQLKELSSFREFYYKYLTMLQMVKNFFANDNITN